jgi:hypothetical protein
MSFLDQYERTIEHLVKLCPQPDKFAHTYAGLTIWLLAAIVLRKPLGSIWPLVVVLAAELGNEYIDFLTYGSWRWHDTLRDMAATWFWPTVLMLAIRAFPHLLRATKGRAKWYS